MANQHRTWTTKEDAYLAQHYEHLSVIKMADILGRSKDAVYTRLSRLGLHRNAPQYVDADDPESLRECRYCRISYPLKDFVKARNKYTWRCNTCVAEYNRLWRASNPQKQSLYTKKYAYGLSEEEFTRFRGDGLCAICREPGSEIDHDHRSGKLRGFLCKKCNMGLGSFMDSIDILEFAVEYLREFS